MKINFRQGIISSYSAGLTPLFLAPSATTGFVDLVVSPEPTVVAFAHAGSDYLQVFNTDVNAAWGPIISGQDAYLYWEIDQLTAVVTFKITTHPPLVAGTAPVSPVVDQFWFDTSTTTMRVWTGTKWLPKIAVFAGVCPSGSINLLQPNGYGSQVGINTSSEPGFVMLSALLKPIYTNPATFEFLTTSKAVRIKTTAGTSGVLATPPNAFVPVRASENIPAFSLVYFSGADTVGLASGNMALPSPRIPIGVVQEDLSVNEMGNLTQSGEVQWDQWDWSAHIGSPLYCDNNGQITTTRPVALLAYRVGFVKNRNTILFNVDAETQPQVYQASPNDILIEGTAPLSTSFEVNLIGERTWTIDVSDATTSSRGVMTATQAQLLQTHSTQISVNAADILTKAPLVHTHVITDVTGLQATLNSKSDIGHNHDLLYSQLVHTHPISGVVGLQAALDDKANAVHTHVITDVAGLQADLDAKFTTASDVLPMSQVTGLASALALKSPVGHTHTIASLTDVVLDDNFLLEDGDALTWNPAGFWENRPVSGGSYTGAANTLAWAYAGTGLITVPGYSGSVSEISESVNAPSGTGLGKYRPFKAFRSSTPHTDTGFGDFNPAVGTLGPPSPGSGEPLVFTQLFDPYSGFNDTTGFYLPSAYVGADWQVTIELVLNPTYIGFSDNFNTPYGSGSRTAVTIGFQFWFGDPSSIVSSSSSPRTPLHTLTSTQVVLQKNQFIDPYNTDDMSDYFVRFVASGNLSFEGNGPYYISWNSYDIPEGTGIAPNGQDYSSIIGYRISMFRVLEKGMLV